MTIEKESTLEYFRLRRTLTTCTNAETRGGESSYDVSRDSQCGNRQSNVGATLHLVEHALASSKAAECPDRGDQDSHLFYDTVVARECMLKPRWKLGALRGKVGHLSSGICADRWTRDIRSCGRMCDSVSH